MKHVLVTGGSGYIGSILVPHLLDQGYHVRVIDRLLFGEGILPQHPDLEIIREDVRNLTPQHFEGIDAVIDMVGISNDPSGEKFQDATWAINHQARAACARLAKQAGVRRYILTSSCSLYGFQAPDIIADENFSTNPLTTYAKANEQAEQDNLPLADEHFTVAVLRLATVFGYAPRMRFDLAINGMTYGAWKTRRLPLMRDGEQWRPLVHVADVAHAHEFMLRARPATISGQIFNVGAAENVYQIKTLGRRIAAAVGADVEIEWYGDPDHRSYRVSFDKIEALGFKAHRVAEDGAREILQRLDAGILEKTPKTITLDWYMQLSETTKI